MRIFALLALALALAHLGFLMAPLRGAENPPNIVLFLADDLGWTGLGCFGSDFYETPHLDRLASEGMKFTDAYAACTVCSPTRASIMTGQYPARLNLTSFIPGQERPFAKMTIPDWTRGLDSTTTTVAEVLRAGGYRTIHVGKWHLNFPNQPADPTRHGFDFSEDRPPGTKGYFLADEAVRELGKDSRFLTDHLADVAVEQISEAGEDPFFLYFAFHVPHTPIQGREDLVEEFQARANPDAVHHNPTYAAMVKSMDLAVGRVLAAVEDRGLAEETLVIFTSDNGGLTERYGKHDDFTENLPLRRGKGSAYEGGVRVPTIVKWPGMTEPGSICDEPIMTIDLFPTLAEVVGLEVDPDAMDGISLVSLLRNPEASLDRDLFWHFPHYHAGGDGPYTAIRSGNWRLIEFHEDGGSVELYDLDEDIGESTNLAEHEPEVVQNLTRRIEDWRKQVEAQMPAKNPDYEPDRAIEVRKRKRDKR